MTLVELRLDQAQVSILLQPLPTKQTDGRNAEPGSRKMREILVAHIDDSAVNCRMMLDVYWDDG